ncbi:hypothetical protein, partial [Pseudomonas sp. KCJK8927]|uniref:hypothetical protein n=1 Tax=Pseudomonas sp. KCJK8927 TaxID=3344560 RepID=UPI003905DBCD
AQAYPHLSAQLLAQLTKKSGECAEAVKNIAKCSTPATNLSSGCHGLAVGKHEVGDPATAWWGTVRKCRMMAFPNHRCVRFKLAAKPPCKS